MPAELEIGLDMDVDSARFFPFGVILILSTSFGVDFLASRSALIALIRFFNPR
jgi:hypothetical protein